MKKVLFALFLPIVCMPMLGQNSIYPNLASESETIQGFVPDGWNILASDLGDLNGDNILDMALVIQSNEKFESPSNEDLTCNARILAIAFKNEASGNYILKQQANKLVSNIQELSMEDPFNSISIARGLLHIKFHYNFSAELGYVNDDVYVFSYRNNRFELISFDSESISETQGQGEILSINFLTNEVVKTIYDNVSGVDLLTRNGKVEPLVSIILNKDTSVENFEIPEIHYTDKNLGILGKEITGF